MGWSKQALIKLAFKNIGLAHYTYDVQPEEFQSALEVMDAMMGTLDIAGNRLGYPIPDQPGAGGITADSRLPYYANEAIYLMLAQRLADSYGMPTMPGLEKRAKKAYITLAARFAAAPEMQLPAGMPGGAGNKNWERPYIALDEDTLEAGPDAELEFK